MRTARPLSERPSLVQKFYQQSVGEETNRTLLVTIILTVSTNVHGTCAFSGAPSESRGLAGLQGLTFLNKFLPASEAILVYSHSPRRETPCGFALTPFLPAIVPSTRTGAACFHRPRPKPMTPACGNWKSPTECS